MGRASAFVSEGHRAVEPLGHMAPLFHAPRAWQAVGPGSCSSGPGGRLVHTLASALIVCPLSCRWLGRREGRATAVLGFICRLAGTVERCLLGLLSRWRVLFGEASASSLCPFSKHVLSFT